MSINQKNNRPGDSRFFKKKGPFNLEKLILAVDAQLKSNDKNINSVEITGVAPLQSANQTEISFLDNKRYLPILQETKAAAVVVSPAFVDKVPQTTIALVTSNPYLAWANIATLFYPKNQANPGIHPTAYIHPDAIVDSTAEVQPFAVIMQGVVIGCNTIIGSHSVIEQGVQIGQYCRIGSHVSISHATVADRVTIYPGARIGQDGFGFAVGKEGFVTVPQIGQVILQEGVEIGSNSTIDRGSVKDTIIGAGSRLDNLVQIGHNVEMGRCCIVVSQAGISGSTRLGDFVTIAAQAGLIGHINIGDNARVGAQCGVMSDVDAKSDVIGSPAMPFKEFFKNVAVLRRLAKSPKNNTNS